MRRKCITISDFNLDNLNSFLRNSADEPRIDIVDCPFGQVHQVLINRNSEVWQEQVDVAVVWTQPQAVIAGFRRLLDFQSVTQDQILADVDEYATHISSIVGRAKSVLVPTWTMPPQERGRGLFDCTDSSGAMHTLMRMNLRLAEQLNDVASVQLLNAQPWTQGSAADAFSPKLWYMAKMPFSNSVFKKVAADLKTAIVALDGGAKKLIVLDLDNTLWGGVVGDLGWEQLTLGGHDAVGEAFVDFQLALKSLQRRGVVLAAASKNEESVALGAMRNHPEMILKPEDFAAWRINWSDKAQNIVDIAAELNLGLQSTVFIDDNPVERDRVAESLSEVFVPEWPTDPLLYRSTLANLSCFDSAAVSDEDLQRAQMYQEQKVREAAKADVSSIDDWLAGLNTTVTVSRLSEANVVRAAQLLNKTNQMNLATRRLSQAEFAEWAGGTNRLVWAIEVDDKFGSQGLTGICSVQRNEETLEIADFLLSCRVMGRKIEETMLSIAIQHAIDAGLVAVNATILPTKKNKPCMDFFARSGMQSFDSDFSYRWDCDVEFASPKHVRIIQATK